VSTRRNVIGSAAGGSGEVGWSAIESFKDVDGEISCGEISCGRLGGVRFTAHASVVEMAGTTEQVSANPRQGSDQPNDGGASAELPSIRRARAAAMTAPTIQKEATIVMAGPVRPTGAFSVASAKSGGVAAPTPVPASTRRITNEGRFGARAADAAATNARGS
jgi:hypothetical protein